MKNIRVGIIGTGGIAVSTHMPAYISLENVEIVAATDKNSKVAQSAAKQFRIARVCKDYRELLRIDEIDAVDICTPNAFHKEIAIAALRAGKHVLVEKPAGITAKEVSAMSAVAKQAKKELMVGLNNRFRPETNFLKKAIEAGALGEIYYAEAIFVRRRGIPGWGAFTQKKLSGGGALLDLGVHALDWALYLMGFPKPLAVSGQSYAKLGKRPHNAESAGYWPWNHKKFDVEDMAVGFVRLQGGCCLSLKTSWAANIAEDDFKVVLVGTEGGCCTNPPQIYREEYGALVDITPKDFPEESGHSEVIRCFIEAIINGKPSPASIESALSVAKIMDGIYSSAKLGKEVRLR